MIEKNIYITGITLPSDIAPNEVNDDTILNVFFTEHDNNMVLQILMPFSIVKNMKINENFILTICKKE